MIEMFFNKELIFRTFVSSRHMENLRKKNRRNVAKRNRKRN